MTIPAERRPARSADVAALAGVSRATVSHVLNGVRADRFPQETKDRVLAAAAQLSYRPSPAGRSLVNGRSDTVVLLVNNTTYNSNLQDAADQLALDTAPLSANVVVTFAATNPADTVASLLKIRPMAVVDLAVLSPADREPLEANGIVIVPRLKTSWATLDSDFDSTLTDLQVQALTTRGPRPILYAALSDKRADPFGTHRFASIKHACEVRALPAPGFVRVPLELHAATEAIAGVVQSGPVGIACYNDDVAMAVLAAARRLGKTVPEQLSVVGVDHTDIGQLWEPRLTTIAVDLRAVAHAAADQIKTVLQTPREPPPWDQGGQLLTFVPGETT